MAQRNKKEHEGVTRRDFLKGLGTGVLGSVVIPASPLVKSVKAASPDVEELAGTVSIQITVNGKVHKVSVEPRTTLLSVLREQLQVTGPKPVCDRGECGACTVLLNGKPVNACMVLAVDAENANIVTAEGLAEGGELTEVQQAFVEKDGLMCGFCTPGFVISATALIKEKGTKLTLADVKAGLAGNLCRCGTYPKVFEAVLTAAHRIEEKGGGV